MVGDGDRGGLTPRSLLSTANMVRQQSDTTGVRRLVRGVAIEDDRPQTSQVRTANRFIDPRSLLLVFVVLVKNDPLTCVLWLWIVIICWSLSWRRLPRKLVQVAYYERIICFRVSSCNNSLCLRMRQFSFPMRKLNHGSLTTVCVKLLRSISIVSIRHGWDADYY